MARMVPTTIPAIELSDSDDPDELELSPDAFGCDAPAILDLFPELVLLFVSDIIIVLFETAFESVPACADAVLFEANTSYVRLPCLSLIGMLIEVTTIESADANRIMRIDNIFFVLWRSIRIEFFKIRVEIMETGIEATNIYYSNFVFLYIVITQ